MYHFWRHLNTDLESLKREFSNKKRLIFHFTTQEEFKIRAVMDSGNFLFSFPGFYFKFWTGRNPEYSLISKIKFYLFNLTSSYKYWCQSGVKHIKLGSENSSRNEKQGMSEGKWSLWILLCELLKQTNIHLILSSGASSYFENLQCTWNTSVIDWKLYIPIIWF